jgi:fibro-slime domain-containing protein
MAAFAAGCGGGSSPAGKTALFEASTPDGNSTDYFGDSGYYSGDAPSLLSQGDSSLTGQGDSGDATVSSCDGNCSSSADSGLLGYCGDGVIESGEQCDDGNSVPGDGCSGTCQIEPGYTCPTQGKPCVLTVTLTCGDGKIEGNEACDDGNTVSGDGCSSTCTVESGYTCPTPGQPCVLISTTDASGPVCGNGKVEAGETCDDGNTASGDGCSSTCQIETGYYCPQPGQPCQLECGDGVVETGEQCDLGAQNGVAGSGCTSTCTVVPGYACPLAGHPCVKTGQSSTCGNGVLDTGEQCDLGAQNGVAGSGCSATCAITLGYYCDAGTTCFQAPPNTCGNGVLDPPEQCDLGAQNGVAGSGCTAVCTIVAGYSCTDAGTCALSQIDLCGNGALDPGELCDDGNTVPGDGCSGVCTIEPGWSCPTAGKPCVRLWVCGNGIVDPGEQCDLGPLNGQGDAGSASGCTATCQVASGFTCSSGAVDAGAVDAAVVDAVAVDAAVVDAVAVDAVAVDAAVVDAVAVDAVAVDAAGAGSVCTPINLCGNGVVDTAAGEQCDTGPLNGTGGCTTSCKIVAGWACPSGGHFACTTVCGDGIVAGNEQCDFGANNGTTDAGVSACTTACTIQSGYACTEPATSAVACHVTVCGDGKTEGAEECDDHNLRPYDGCSPWCKIEPTCAKGSCTAVCGDGQVTAPEQCDDGNTVSGDGCSSTCQIEPGWTCAIVTQPPAASLVVPILYRDMHFCNQADCGAQTDGYTSANNKLTPNTPANGHPDFNRDSYNLGQRTGLVAAQLGADNEPVFASATGNGTGAVLTSAIDYCWWYHDTGCAGVGSANPFASDVWLDGAGNPMTLLLAQQGTGSYVYQFANLAFFPLNGLGWDNPSATANPGWWDDAQTYVDCSEFPDGGLVPTSQTGPQNFSFTSELHYRFTYQANATPAPQFTFVGDDDVWAFVNGQIFMDLGGMHDHLSGSVTLSPQNVAALNLNLVDQGIYSIDLFQAERHTCRSTYQVTLGDFVHQISQCTATCGDGLPASGKQCDLGAANNTGSYGGCTAKCALAGYCGDGIVQDPPEQCDLGTANNTGGYGGCNANCTRGPYCGDGSVEPPEQCDYGTANNTGAYGGCTANCTLAPYCGDGKIQPPEQCDDGTANNTGAYGGCNANCTLGPSCGDGIVEAPEQCDDGANNGTVYSSCTTQCLLKCTTCGVTATCGDGILQSPPEQCDLGTANNTGGYDGCNSNCTLGPYCGDGKVETPPEQCDLGTADNTGAYGGCEPNCTLAPYCGDGVVQPPEQCDNGAGNVSPTAAYGYGLCTTDCTLAPFCGDGTVQAPEQCDDGIKNGTAASNCDTQCRIKCGNGIVDPGEQCDFGTANNTGAYGGCTATCTLGPYCGDGIVQDPPEQCDNGKNNQPVATAYGAGVCTAACTKAPYCGDGIVQSQFGESCDGTPGCTSGCTFKTGTEK